ncbi:MAG TPA: hypothetical protein V6C81_28840 [Planktothrix sp.]|jgi:hypothetical protein
MATSPGLPIDASSKYAGEASAVAKLLETDNRDEAAQRLSVDSHLSPHESQAFLDGVKARYNQDRASNPNLPDLDIKMGKGGYKVALNTESGSESVFEKKFQNGETSGDQPIPRTGDMLGLTDEQTKSILGVQSYEKAQHKPQHKFGDIAVSLGFRTPDEVNDALARQDYMHADRLVEDLSHGMPIGKGEGYYQMLRRTHPELSEQDALVVSHGLRFLNDNKTVLHVGDQVPMMDDRTKAQMKAQIFESMRTKTGTVHAQFGQPLDQVAP